MSHPRNEAVELCCHDGCGRPKRKGGADCEGHHKRKVRTGKQGGELRSYGHTARAFAEAAFALADAADSGDGETYLRNFVRLCMSGRRHLFPDGVPPKGKQSPRARRERR